MRQGLWFGVSRARSLEAGQLPEERIGLAGNDVRRYHAPARAAGCGLPMESDVFFLQYLTEMKGKRYP